MRGSTVLIVDDDQMLRDAVQRKLEGEQFKTVTAATGGEALELLNRSDAAAPDLVLLDIMLPDIEGTSVCQQIRQKSSVPIIMLTARTDALEQCYSQETGADGYIAKPFSLDALLANIKQCESAARVNAP